MPGSDPVIVDRRSLLATAAALPFAAAFPGAAAGAELIGGGRLLGFGVNYGLASASAYRFLKASGASPEATIATDLDHLRRLGLDGLRLCFWGDWENSDAAGNLIDNEHLRLLERIVAEAEARRIAILLSPIATYDADWPDALGRPRAGLSSAYDKSVFESDPAAIRAQCNYLGQLMRHKSRVTGRAIADEPAIIAVEPVNEPVHHPEDREGSIRYIGMLVSALRAGGWRGPVVWNASQDMAIADVIAAADVQGATFAWYPTGLQNGHAMGGNQLLLVQHYPELDDPRLSNRAKLVYEFDAADSMKTYMYPAMARAFRAGGAGFAAAFSYDPLPIASGNLEFNDHFLNLVHTPAKAISLMIAGEAFRRVTPGARFGPYPEDCAFAGVRLDDAADLAELIDVETYFHTADTRTPPPRPERLRRVAGCGSSPVARYRGLGAYFLDQLAPGAWRLELYPDAILVSDPFDQPGPSRRHTRIVSAPRLLALALPDLGFAFVVSGPKGERFGDARDGEVTLSPGVYLLRRSKAVSAPSIDTTHFHAPAGEQFDPIILHQPVERLVAGEPWRVHARIAHAEASIEATLWVRRDGRFSRHALKPGPTDFDFVATVPADAMAEGAIDYFIAVTTDGGKLSEPGGVPLTPADWDFPRIEGWRSSIVPASAPVRLFAAVRDRRRMIFPYGGYQPVAHMGFAPGGDIKPALTIDGAGLPHAPEHDLSCQLTLAQPGTVPEGGERRLLVRGRAARGRRARVAIILIERDGACWGGTVALTPEFATLALPVADLEPCDASMLPKGFPAAGRPYWLPRPPRQSAPGARPRLSAVEAIQFAVAQRFLRPGDDPDALAELHEVILA